MYNKRRMRSEGIFMMGWIDVIKEMVKAHYSSTGKN